MRKTTALVAGGIGYVLGARAGRQRYEQIRDLAMRVKNNPTVQEKAAQAADLAKEAAPAVKDKVASSSDATSSSGTSAPTGTATNPA